MKSVCFLLPVLFLTTTIFPPWFNHVEDKDKTQINNYEIASNEIKKAGASLVSTETSGHKKDRRLNSLDISADLMNR
jgi:hypothetical protein